MFRGLLCASIVALATLAAAAAPAVACGHRSHCETEYRYYDPFACVGFFDYRHSLDPEDNPEYQHHRRRLDRDLDYVFHCMTPHEAGQLVHGGGCGSRRSEGDDCGSAVKIKRHSYRGGGDHHHAWGLHSSDHCD